MKKLKAICFFSAIISTAAFGFDWPQKETESDSFYSYFGQLRGTTISTSLIFSNTSDVKASEAGTMQAVITEHTDDFGWFESTLGNAVILGHDDNISTIYANLDEDSLSEDLINKTDIQKGEHIGESANSGWQEGMSCLEFQVLDTKNSNAINPRILMPRIGKELPLTAKNICLINKKGKVYNLATERTLPSGTYYIYKDRQEVAVPYRTVVSINGVAYENISYDTLNQKSGKLCAHGNTFYDVKLLYPNDKMQLMGQINLTRGRHTLTVNLMNILGNSEFVRFNIDVQ